MHVLIHAASTYCSALPTKPSRCVWEFEPFHWLFTHIFTVKTNQNVRFPAYGSIITFVSLCQMLDLGCPSPAHIWKVIYHCGLGRMASYLCTMPQRPDYGFISLVKTGMSHASKAPDAPICNDLIPKPKYRPDTPLSCKMT